MHTKLVTKFFHVFSCEMRIWRFPTKYTTYIHLPGAHGQWAHGQWGCVHNEHLPTYVMWYDSSWDSEPPRPWRRVGPTHRLREHRFRNTWVYVGKCMPTPIHRERTLVCIAEGPSGDMESIPHKSQLPRVHQLHSFVFKGHVRFTNLWEGFFAKMIKSKDNSCLIC